MLLASNRYALGARFALERMQGPERALVGLSLGGWLALTLIETRTEIPLMCVSSPDAMSRLAAEVEALARPDLVLVGLAAWLAMIAAMMYPLLLHPVRHVALRSFYDRRIQAIASFLIAYSGVWLAAGVVVAAIFVTAKSLGLVALDVVKPAVFAAAALWQYSNVRRRALRRCHRTVPLVPRGLRADIGCLRFGAWHGSNCLLTCGPAMLAMLTLHSIPLCGMLAVALFVERGRIEPSAAPLAGLLMTIAAGCFFVAVQTQLG